MRSFIAMATMGWAAGALAQASGPDSVACRQALDALQAEESAALAAARSAPPSASAPGATATALQPWRDRAARACLGGNSGGNSNRVAATPGRRAQPPVTVPPVTTGPPVTLPAPPAAPSVPSVPARSEPMLTIAGCDATGCWASDGSRLTRVGPNLVGPRGTCTLQGALLRCP